MTEHEEFEIGHHLDQALRAAMTGAAQLIERHARTAQQRDRDRADAQRAQAMDTRRAVDEHRREWLDQRDSARALYSPWTRPGMVERGDRVEAARAWAQAAGWAEQDPRAATASTDLHRRIVDAHGTDPQSILTSVEGPNQPYALPAGWISMREAVELANEEAPYYYHRHEDPRLGRLDQRPNGEAQQQLWNDWQHWAEHGQLPPTALHEAWAEHNQRNDEFSTDRFLTDTGVIDYPARTAALREYWTWSASDRERGELQQHLAEMRQAGMDPATLPLDEAAANPIAASAYETMRRVSGDPAEFEQADIPTAVTAWQTATLATSHDPNDQAAATARAQLREQFQRRWNVDPAAYLADAHAQLVSARADTARDHQAAAEGHAATAQARTETAAPTSSAQPPAESERGPDRASPAAAFGDRPATPQASGAQQPPPSSSRTGGEERGMAPSKAGTATEKAHRAQAWAAAEAEFRKTLPPGTSSEGAGKAWRALDWPDKNLRYWTAYDDPDVRRKAGLPAQPPATTLAGQTGTRQPNQQTPATASAAEPAISRTRVIELNTLAADYFADNLRPGTRGHDYLAERLGTEQLSQTRWRVGYAPAGWTNLTGHLRQAGATNDEIVAAGLGRVSSRGNVIDAFRDRAMLGIHDQHGELVGFTGRDLSGNSQAPKYINTEGTPAYRKGDHLFGLYEAPPGARLARAEGAFDAMAITAAGNGQVAGVAPLGTAMTDTQARQLANRGPVLLALDNDKPGRAAAEKAFWALADHQVDVRHLPLPDDTDPAKLWQDNPETLRTALADPDQAPTAGLLVMDNALDEHRARILEGDDEARLELAYTQGEISEAITDPAGRDQLARYTEQRIEALHSDASRDRDTADRLDTVEDRTAHAADTSRDPEQSEQLDQAANRADAVEDRADARAQQQEHTAGDADAGLNLAREPYNRAATVAPEVSDEVRDARQVSAYGYTQPTRDMLAEADHRRGRQAKPSPANQKTGRVRTQRR